MYYSRQDRNYNHPVMSISMICHEEPLSEVQFKAYKTRLEEYKNFLENTNRLANSVNVCITEEPVSVGENGLLTGEALNALQHAGSISVYNFFQQHNWEYPSNPEGEMAVVRPHNPVTDEFLDSEQPIRPDWPAVHLTKCFVDQEKAKLHGSALPLRTYLPPTISFRNAADVDDTMEPEVRTKKQILSQEGDFEFVSTDEGIMVQKCVSEGKEAQLVPLYDFYYGRIEGRNVMSEVKAEYRFSCASCQNVFYSNVSVMQHILSHIDEQTMKQFTSADLTNCSTCGSDFPNAFELRNHMEVEHMSIMGPDGEQQVLIDTNNGHIICTVACRICEKNCESNYSLAYHLQHHHRQHEMPYRCGICNFHTSLYQDVICHFKKVHCDTNQLLCPYCLRTFSCSDALAIDPSAPPSANAVVGQTSLYFRHVKTHKDQLFKHCTGCTLNFVNKADFELHRRLDHKTQAIEMGGEPHQNITVSTVSDSIEARNNEIFGKHNAELSSQKIESPVSTIPQIKKMNAPEPSRVKDLSGLSLPVDIDNFMCIECGDSLGIDKHKRYLPCSMCRFASCCGDSFHKHVINKHTATTASSSNDQLTTTNAEENNVVENSSGGPTLYETAGALSSQFYCSKCAATDLDGNALATHLVEECGEYVATMVPDPKLLAARAQAEREHSAMDVSDTNNELPSDRTQQPSADAQYQSIDVDELTPNQDTSSAQVMDNTLTEDIKHSTTGDNALTTTAASYPLMEQDTDDDQQLADNTQTITIPDNIELKPQESLVLLMLENNAQEFVIVNTADIGTPQMQEYFNSRNASNIYVLQSNDDMPETT